MTSPEQPPVIGVIGLGTMGLACCRALRNHGLDVAGFDLDPAAVAALEAIGGTGCAAPSEVADQASVILLALPTVEALDTATAGPDGIAAALLPNSIICDLSGLPAPDQERAATVLAAAGGTYLDCAVDGTPDQAASGDLTIHIRGDAAAAQQARPVLAALSRHLRGHGPQGAA